MDSIVQRAKRLAHQWHFGQLDQAGRPYIEHVTRVAAAVSDDPEAEAVAWLHDVFEDTDLGIRILRPMFPNNIIEAVKTITVTWFKDRADYYAAVRQNQLALRVKLADIADNADESRLALLDKATAARLRSKYKKAVAALSGGR